TLAGAPTAGLVIQNGVLKSLDMAVTSNLTFAALSLTTDSLRVTYAAATGTIPETLTVTGPAHFSLPGNTVTVVLGGPTLAGTPTAGLAFQSGVLRSLVLAVTRHLPF